MPRGKGQGGASMVGKHPFYHVPSTTKECDIGQRFEDDFGRVFYYAKGGVAMPMYAGTSDGNLVQGPADYQTRGITATYFGANTSDAPASGKGGAIGDTIIQLNDCDAAAEAHELQGGFLHITNGTGEGFYYPIVDNEVLTTSSGQDADIVIAEPGLVVALDNSSVGVMIPNMYDGVIEYDASEVDQNTVIVMGACLRPTTATGQYLWLQTWGHGIARADSSHLVGDQGFTASADDGVDGCVTQVAADMGIQAGMTLGLALQSTQSTLWGPVIWMIHR